MSNTPLNWSWNLNKCCPRWCFYWTWSLWVWCYSQESGGEIWVDGGQIWLGFRLRSFQQIYCRKGMQWKLAIDLDFSWGVGLTPSHQYIEWILYRILNNKIQKTLQLAWAPPCRWNSRSSSKTCSSPSFFFDIGKVPENLRSDPDWSIVSSGFRMFSLWGCMGFVMATFYLVNWPDDDIRQISLEVSLGRRGSLRWPG